MFQPKMAIIMLDTRVKEYMFTFYVEFRSFSFTNCIIIWVYITWKNSLRSRICIIMFMVLKYSTPKSIGTRI